MQSTYAAARDAIARVAVARDAEPVAVKPRASATAFRVAGVETL
jgi:hypothetical protein